MTTSLSAALKRKLDALYKTYDFASRVEHDPIKFPKRYKRKADIEVVAFIASALAYGQVQQFSRVLEDILHKLGKKPYDYLIAFDPTRELENFSGIEYRFQKSADIVAFLYSLGRVLDEQKSLNALYLKFASDSDTDTRAGLTGMVETLLSVDTSSIYGDDRKPRGLRHMLPNPSGSSACKRLCLFMRWVVRTSDIDLGIWRGVPKSNLVIPLDTHIQRVARCLGLTSRASNDWRTAREITDSLRELDPDDPVKYDFALCHRGISGVCRADLCTGCDLGTLRIQ